MLDEQNPLSPEIIRDYPNEWALVLDIFDTLRTMSFDFIKTRDSKEEEHENIKKEKTASYNKQKKDLAGEKQKGLEELEKKKSARQEEIKQERDGKKKAYDDAMKKAEEEYASSINKAKETRDGKRKDAVNECGGLVRNAQLKLNKDTKQAETRYQNAEIDENKRYDEMEHDLSEKIKALDASHNRCHDAHERMLCVKHYEKLVKKRKKFHEISIEDYDLLIECYKFDDQCNKIINNRSFFKSLSARYISDIQDFYSRWVKENELYATAIAFWDEAEPLCRHGKDFHEKINMSEFKIPEDMKNLWDKIAKKPDKKIRLGLERYLSKEYHFKKISEELKTLCEKRSSASTEYDEAVKAAEKTREQTFGKAEKDFEASKKKIQGTRELAIDILIGTTMDDLEKTISGSVLADGVKRQLLGTIKSKREMMTQPIDHEIYACIQVIYASLYDRETELHDLAIAKFKSQEDEKERQCDEKHKSNVAENGRNREKELQSVRNGFIEGLQKILPSNVVTNFDNAMRKKDKRVFENFDNFEMATTEPLNVTVGSALVKPEAFGNDGEVTEILKANYPSLFSEKGFKMAYSIPFNENFSAFYKYSGRQMGVDVAKKQILAICLNSFVTMPANKMRFHFVDPVQKDTFAPFLHFQDDAHGGAGIKVIVDGIIDRPGDIEKKLSDLSDYITATRQSFLGLYENIGEYNKNNNLFPLSYYILAVMDFPSGFSDKSFEYLQTIVDAGKRCGVYCVIMNNTDNLANLKPEFVAGAKAIENLCVSHKMQDNFNYSLEESDNNKKWSEYLEISLNNALYVRELTTISGKMKDAIREAGRVIIDYECMLPRPEEIFSGKSEDGISVLVGMKTGGNLVKLELGQEGGQHNALVVGNVGSGKSKFLHTVIVDALQRYSAEELEIYLIDFKDGVEFAQYTDYKIPNFKAIALESEQEFGVGVLNELRRSMNERARKFYALGSSIVNIKNYNRRVNTLKEQGIEDVPKKIPRVLLIMDEFHYLFSANNPELANKAKAYLAEIIREGRAFGIHVILSTQSTEEVINNIDGGTLGQITTRFAFKCGEDDAKNALGEESEAIARVEKNDPGSAIFRSNITEKRNAEHFKAAYIDTEKPLFDEILSDLQGEYAANGIDTETRILVSDVGRSRDNIFDIFMKTKNSEIPAVQNTVHFGESVELKKNAPTVTFDKNGGENLLLIGVDDNMGQNLLFFMTVDLALQKIKASRDGAPVPRIFVFNLNDLNDGSEYITHDSLTEFGLQFPKLFDYRAFGGEGITEKLQEAGRNIDTAPLNGERTYVIISNMGNQQVFSTEGTREEDVIRRNNYESLKKLVTRGPSCGIHTISWHKNYKVFNEQFPEWMPYFKKRIAFKMPGDDANAFARVPAEEESLKTQIAQNAFLFNILGECVKIRPYGTPTRIWLDKFYEKIEECLKRGES